MRKRPRVDIAAPLPYNSGKICDIGEFCMLDQFSRTELILGRDAMERLAQARVAVFGIGGVGGYTVEALARSGVGALDLIDDDRVCLTNINRQILATRKTVGKYKVDVAEERILSINPNCVVRKYQMFYLPETADQFDFTQYDYIVDAIDTVSGKLSLVEQANRCGTPIICAMGAGNKMDASAFRVADIYETSVCPLARVMRTQCRKRGIRHLKVVYSQEKPIRPLEDASISCRNHCICPPGTTRKCTERRDIPGSTAFVPPVVGLIIAGEVVRDLPQHLLLCRRQAVGERGVKFRQCVGRDHDRALHAPLRPHELQARRKDENSSNTNRRRAALKASRDWGVCTVR